MSTKYNLSLSICSNQQVSTKIEDLILLSSATRIDRYACNWSV